MMKKLLLWAIVPSCIMLASCTKGDNSKDEPGSIYGIVTVVGTAEPMKAVGVELYKKDSKSQNENDNYGDATLAPEAEGGYNNGYHSGVYGYALLLKTVTFDDGHFEFKDLNPENYQVKVVADGYDQIEDGYVTVEAGRQARIDLQVNKKFSKPSVATLRPSFESSTSATLHGQIISEGSPVYIERGFVYSDDYDFMIDNDKAFNERMQMSYYYGVIWLPVSGRSEDFSADIFSLWRIDYGVRAYAKYEGGIVYGSCINFSIGETRY